MHSYIFLKQGPDDRTLFSLRKQAKCTYQKTVVRVFLLFLRHPLLHLYIIDVKTFRRAQLDLGVFLPARIVRLFFFHGLLIFSDPYVPPPKGTFLLRCSSIFIVLPHANCATSTRISRLFSSILSCLPSLHLPL